MTRITTSLALGACLCACAPLNAYIQALPEDQAAEPAWKPSTEVLQEEGFTRQDVAFACGDTTCAATLYLPEGADRPPVVVMGNGFCGERDSILPAYAERFARAGLAAFTIDYRHFGDSGGLPRYSAVAEDQVEDYLAALAHVRGRDDVDGARVAIWGTSYSGAHVITVASRDPEVRALVSQVPGLAEGDHDAYPKGALWKLVRLSFMDKARQKRGEPRIYVPAYGSAGEFAMIAGAEEGLRLFPPADDWPNLVTIGELLDGDEYHPLRYARRVTAPALFVVAERDELIDNKGAHKAAKRMADARVESIDAGHFEFYTGKHLERSAALEIAFFQEHLAE